MPFLRGTISNCTRTVLHVQIEFTKPVDPGWKILGFIWNCHKKFLSLYCNQNHKPMKTITKLMNLFLYLGTMSLTMSCTIVGYIIVAKVIEMVPMYVTIETHLNFIEIILWSGWIFSISMTSHFGYKLYKQLKLS
jgi:uncharacterized membrane protein